MVLQLPIEYEQLIVLIEQLSEEQQTDVVERILARRLQQRALSIEEKLKLLDSIKMNVPVNEEPSIRREDWYNDEGR